MFSPDLLRLAETVLEEARPKRHRIVTAESCTGGLIAACLTEIAGSSDVLECGFVVYSDVAKVNLLGVSSELIATFGAVSAEVATEMARGALRHASAGLAVAVTGVAGPGGGTALKPVGLVHLAVADASGRAQQEEHRFGNVGREEVRLKTVEAALRLLLRLL